MHEDRGGPETARARLLCSRTRYRIRHPASHGVWIVSLRLHLMQSSPTTNVMLIPLSSQGEGYWVQTVLKTGLKCVYKYF